MRARTKTQHHFEQVASLMALFALPALIVGAFRLPRLSYVALFIVLLFLMEAL